MSTAIHSFAVIHNNPFTLAPLFPAFFSALSEKPKSWLLAYLVLPLVLSPASRKFLINATSKSSVRTFISDRNRLFGLAELMAEYRDLTDICIQHLIDLGLIKSGEDLVIWASSTRISEDCSPDGTVRAASKLGELFAPFDVPTIYRMMGIKRL